MVISLLRLSKNVRLKTKWENLCDGKLLFRRNFGLFVCKKREREWGVHVCECETACGRESESEWKKGILGRSISENFYRVVLSITFSRERYWLRDISDKVVIVDVNGKSAKCRCWWQGCKDEMLKAGFIYSASSSIAKSIYICFFHHILCFGAWA